MAWIKKITNPLTNAIGSYCEIVSVTYLKQSATTQAIIGIWLNKAAYTDNMQPIYTINYVWPSNPTVAAQIEAFVDAYARAQTDFTGSTNIS